MIDLYIETQIIKADDFLPSKEQIISWAKCALRHVNFQHDAEITVRFVSNEEIQQLNLTYRQKNKATNILSFPFDTPEEIAQEEICYLGDLVIANDVVKLEAQEQNKSIEEHFAHLIVHGCLHLLGYDHIDDSEAEEMESLEIAILAQLGYKNPY